MTPEEVGALFEEDVGDKASKTARLQEVLVTAKELWENGSTDLDHVAERLGNGSRKPSWRLPIGESGLLDFFVYILQQDDLRPALKTHSLRLVGNACADEDENRARVTQGGNMASLIRLLADDGALQYAVPVLYNICVDYEPAQRLACEAGLSRQLVELISSPRFGAFRPLLGFICKLVGFMASQDVESSFMNPATPSFLLKLATSKTTPIDLSTFNDLTTVALAYLATESLHPPFLQDGGFPLLQQTFSDSYSRFDGIVEEEDEIEQLRQTQAGFVKLLSDLSAEPSFVNLHPLGSPVVLELLSWLRTPAEYTHLQSAACLCLGNLARSDKTSMDLLPVAFSPLKELLARTAPGPSTAALLHAILSVLKHLAIPTGNRATVGALLDPPQSLLPQIWSSSTASTNPQLQFAAISLTRLLVAGSPINARRFCAPLSQDPSSPAHERSNLHVLITLFDRLDAEPSKMEAARAVAAVCRVLHSTPILPHLPPEWAPEDDSFTWHPPSPAPSSILGGADSDIHTSNGSTLLSANGSNNTSADPTSRLARFYASQPDLNRPLIYLITQKRHPALRSEAWFVFALMSRTKEGAQVVIRVLQPYESMQALVEAVTGKDFVSGRELLPSMQGLEGEDGEAGQIVSEDVHMPDRDEKEETPFAEAEGLEAQGLTLQPQPVEQGAPMNMGRVDRENALVMLAELMRNHADNLSPLRKPVFDELLREGGKSILLESSKGSDAD